MQVITILSFLFLSLSAFSQKVFKKQTVLMGSVFEIIVQENDSLKAQQHFQTTIEEIERIENLISEWRPATQISEVNRNAGIQPVKVDKEVFDLTSRAIRYSNLTNGAFDISIAAMDKIWFFDGSMENKPTDTALKKSIENVGYQYIRLDSLNSTIFLEKRGMKIGFGSIGKGYAADKGRELLEKRGVKGGIVNASGDLAAWNKNAKAKPWKIGVNHPHKSGKIYKTLKLKNGSVATSGSNEKFAEISGVRYSHIINPKTGWPASELMSVTVVGENTEFANFLSTSIMVLGKKEGQKLINQFPAYKAIMINSKPNLF